ncbi:MAG: ROK family protein [Nanoarchaeota archaeon]|nr:ROK family protein [Nanoarchaeota archaeon]
MTAIGIDVGGHSIKAGIVTKKGIIREKEVIMTDAEKGRAAIVSNIVKIAKYFLNKYKDVKAIGVGIPGTVDKKGYITYTPNIPLSKYDLGKELRKSLKIKKIVFGNDADNFALAKHRFGAGRGHKTIITLTLGTGVGSGIIIDGKLFSNNGAPELGHTTINFDGPEAKCCGNDGCIESYIGRKCFGTTPLEVYKKALINDDAALQKFSDYGKYLGIAISNFINIFNPDVIILGGEISNAYGFFKKTLEEEVKKRTLFKTKIIKSKMREGGLIGAATLAF